VKTALWSGERLVVIEDVPALVCQHCGDQFYEDETVMRLDMMRGGGFTGADAARQMTVPVFSFAASGRVAGGGGDEG
jgi:YgiT-type zinc finger domain-containing protein